MKRRNIYIYNILISVNNENTDKYVMIYDYHGFEIKGSYPKKIQKNTETIIDYNFFLNENINNNKQDSIVNDPAIENTSESFTLLILPKGKTNVTLKNISLPNLNTNKKYLYFSKMEEETFRALPKGTRIYDIIADEKGFRNYKFSKKIIPF
ncbi:hypothetical protein P2W68_04025 [Chryseobacterium arthrosphaerae]|uniref:hypothetical protein n=1 Tax=Chryseobacterium arthrosphaerae TaxID=651561 RepID=UPI0023E20FB6|nr:hypothetical protein [Chryseobacterium arthrosphaerae]WES98781.1 hypothetical protein P2W68_04025 [Chryseobacterium arthrosphaerae]